MKSSHLKMDSTPLFCASDAIKLCRLKEPLTSMRKCHSLSSFPSNPTTNSNLQTNCSNKEKRRHSLPGQLEVGSNSNLQTNRSNNEKRCNSLPSQLEVGSNHTIDLPVTFATKSACASKVKSKDLKPEKKSRKCSVSNLKERHKKESVKPLRSSPRHRKTQRNEENDLAKTGCDSSSPATDENNTIPYFTEGSQIPKKNSDESQVKMESKLPIDNETVIPQKSEYKETVILQKSESRNKRKRKTKRHSRNSSREKEANSEIHDFPDEIIEQNNNDDITCKPVSEHRAKRKKSHKRTKKDIPDEESDQSFKPKSEYCAKRKKGEDKAEIQPSAISDSIQTHSSSFRDRSKSKKSKKHSKRKSKKKKRTSVSPNNLDSETQLPDLNCPKRLQWPSDVPSVPNSETVNPESGNYSAIPTLTKDKEASDVSPEMKMSDISSSRMSKRSKRKRDNSDERTPEKSEYKNQDKSDSDDSNNLKSKPGSAHFDVNLNEDSCEESDDDLPDFSSQSNDILYSPKVNDYVWVKWRKDPYWPSKIVAVEKKKVKVTFFGYKDDRFTVSFKNGVVVPFSSSKASEFIENGRKHKLKEKFNIGYKEITNEMMDKYLQNDSPSIQKCSASEDQFADSFYSQVNGSDDEECFKADPVNTTPVKSKKPRPKSLSLDVKVTPKMKEKYVQQIERLKERNMKLIAFIKTDQVREHLQAIYHGTIKSELHDKYTSSEHGKREMEEISLEFLEESQVDEVLGVLVKWYEELTGNALARIAYVINVWLHEAIVYSLVKVKKYTKKKAWQIYAAPPKTTRVAEIIQHQQMISSTDSLETRLARLRPPPKMTLK